MADSPRIEELRRRVQSDPASIAFAALAEEYRRAGRFDEAIETCNVGLQRHPAYLSARVTLGRALLEVARYEEAQQELEHVLKLAPENLAAIRGLAEIHHRRGDEPHDDHYHAAIEAHREAAQQAPIAVAQAPAPVAPETASVPVAPEPVAPRPISAAQEPAPISVFQAPPAQPAAVEAPSMEPVLPEPQARIPLSAEWPVPAESPALAESAAIAEPPAFSEPPAPAEPPPPPPDPALSGLEEYLAAILRAKAQRSQAR